MSKTPPRPPADGARVAAILAEAKLFGDVATAEKHGISTRTIQRWRVAANTERPEIGAAVSANVAEARSKAISEWASVIDDTISEAVAYIRWAAEVPDGKKERPSALMVQSLVSAVKTLHEMKGGNGDKPAPTTINIYESVAAKPE